MAGDMVYEDVPTFLKREGDVVFSGRNNAMLVVGRDRLTTIDSGQGAKTGSGAMTMVVGRSSENLSLADDSATVLLSMSSQPDSELSTAGGPPASVVVLRADRVLFVPRDELTIKVGQSSIIVSKDGSIAIEGNVSFGTGAFERLVKESFVKMTFQTHIHPDPPTPGGFTGPPTVPAPDNVLSSRARSL